MAGHDIHHYRQLAAIVYASPVSFPVPVYVPVLELLNFCSARSCRHSTLQNSSTP